MTSSLAFAPSNANHDAARASARIQRHLARFLPRHRAAVTAMAARDPRLADLAVSFPALLFALSVPRFGHDVAPQITSVLAGAPLKELARGAGLPMWSRRLMPECFDGTIGLLPDGDFVARQICNHLPRSPKTAPKWLHAVSAMHRWGTPEMAVWMAREVVRDAKTVELKRAELLGLFGFFSAERQTRAGSAIDKPWQPHMQFKTAIVSAEDWRRRWQLTLEMGDKPVADMWLAPAVVDGFTFVPLRTVDDITQEAIYMQNCLRNYGNSIANDRLRLWSMRQHDVPIATVSLWTCNNGLVTKIEDVLGPKNVRPDEQVTVAAHKWAISQPLRIVRRPPDNKPDTLLDCATWRTMWKPYWLAKQRIPPWLPLLRMPHKLFDL